MNTLGEFTSFSRKSDAAFPAVVNEEDRPDTRAVVPIRTSLDADLAKAARRCLMLRRARDARFPAPIFADPAWDMILDLFAAELEGSDVSVSSACIAASVPPTTALRYIARMEAAGVIVRKPDPRDRRRTFVHLSSDARDKMRDWLQLAGQ